MDSRLRLLCGSSDIVGDFLIKPYVLRDIIEIGYENFLSKIGILCFDVDYFLKQLIGQDFYMEIYEKKHELEPLELYLMFSHGDAYEFGELFKESLSLVLRVEKKDIFLNLEENCIMIASNDDVKLIHSKTFNEIVEIVKYQNGMKTMKEKEEDENPADDRAKAILDKIRSNREKVNKFKSEDKEESETDFYDIVNAISVRSNSINKLNIVDLTIFQIYEEFSRLQAIDNYENYLKASMAGVKMEGKTPHWSDKI